MPTKQLDYFSSLVAEDEHFPLTEAAIAVAHHAYPDLDVQEVLDNIDLMVEKLKQRITSDTPHLQRLQHYESSTSHHFPGRKTNQKLPLINGLIEHLE